MANAAKYRLIILAVIKKLIIKQAQ